MSFMCLLFSKMSTLLQNVWSQTSLKSSNLAGCGIFSSDKVTEQLLGEICSIFLKNPKY